MSIRLTIQGKLLVLGFVGLAFVGIVGATGYAAATRLAGAGERIVGDGAALKNQMSADQAHDALRADVLAAIVAGEHKDAAEEKTLRAEFEEHAGRFRDAMKALEAMPLDDVTRAAVGRVRPALLAYLDSATRLVSLAFSDRSAAIAGLGDFNLAFRTLEKEMDTLSQVIENRATSTQAASRATASTAQIAIAVAVALSVGMLLAVSVVISRGIVQPIRRAVEIAETVAAGDLSSDIDVRGHDETAQLLAALKRMNDRLVEVVDTVRLSSHSIATGSSQIATGNQDLSQRTEEQASNLQQTAASMEQITATVKANADTTRQAAELARVASQAAEQGGQAVGHVVGTMGGIADSSRRINEIIAVIDGIAFQTNILALNAAVEAARAGEQGRGFAVVAGEVRTLAQRSAAAAKDIKVLIQSSVEKVEAGSRQASDAGAAMQGIVAQVHRVTQLIGEISAATHEQTTGIGQVSDAVAQLEQVTQQNAALVEESAAAAESLRAQSGQLVSAVAVFRLR
jgi:methyl-accepting chemotaxis protein